MSQTNWAQEGERFTSYPERKEPTAPDRAGADCAAKASARRARSCESAARSGEVRVSRSIHARVRRDQARWATVGACEGASEGEQG
eukprot:410827-Prymnesium_polylepis.2